MTKLINSFNQYGFPLTPSGMRMQFLLMSLALSWARTPVSFGQAPLLTVRTSSNKLVAYVNGQKGNFTEDINQLSSPFSVKLPVPPTGLRMSVVSEKDSVGFIIQQGQTTHLQLIREAKADSVLINIAGITTLPAVHFTPQYIQAHQGTNSVEIPEVYELISIAIALTEQGHMYPYQPNDSPYYQQVSQYFKPYANDTVIGSLNAALKASPGSYNRLKMDAYAYYFQGDTLRKSAIYDRTSWDEYNNLEDYVPALSAFARRTKFRQFYAQHQAYYDQLIATYQRVVRTAHMKAWLEQQFPRWHYASLKTIFSPLTAGVQATNHFEDNGFREAHLYVNYPFDPNQAVHQGAHPEAQVIAFTELNHDYINPQATLYAPQIERVFTPLAKWIGPQQAQYYPNAYLLFAEYVNWALLSPYFVDQLASNDFETFRTGLEQTMHAERGFLRFRAFNAELLRLYQLKKPGQTVADLYPALLAWSANQD